MEDSFSVMEDIEFASPNVHHNLRRDLQDVKDSKARQAALPRKHAG